MSFRLFDSISFSSNSSAFRRLFMMAAIEKFVILQLFKDLSPVDDVTLGGGLGDGVALASLMSVAGRRVKAGWPATGVSRGRACDVRPLRLGEIITCDAWRFRITKFDFSALVTLYICNLFRMSSFFSLFGFVTVCFLTSLFQRNRKMLIIVRVLTHSLLSGVWHVTENDFFFVFFFPEIFFCHPPVYPHTSMRGR